MTTPRRSLGHGHAALDVSTVQLATKFVNERNPHGSWVRINATPDTADLAAIVTAVPADAVIGDLHSDMSSIDR
jgi:hypothetical protein